MNENNFIEGNQTKGYLWVGWDETSQRWQRIFCDYENWIEYLRHISTNVYTKYVHKDFQFN